MDDLYAYDKAQGVDMLCGVDEAGRGPLAGPVFAAAVILNPNDPIEGINDSKKLSPKKREALYDEITARAVCFHIASATVTEIDEINILNATLLAMKRAVSGLTVKPSLVLIDGDKNTDVGCLSKSVVKGDGKSASIAAASVLAKVARDRYMTELDKEYPQYMLAKNKGYGTKLHTEMILKYGPGEVHRKTFLKKLLAGNRLPANPPDSSVQAQKTLALQNPQSEFNKKSKERRDVRLGRIGEEIAARYLAKKGYSVILKNYRKTCGEIDLIAEKDGVMSFVEVKTRKSDRFAKPKEAVDRAKQERLSKAAAEYIAEFNIELPIRFDVIEVLLKDEKTVTINHIPHAFDTY